MNAYAGISICRYQYPAACPACPSIAGIRVGDAEPGTPPLWRQRLGSAPRRRGSTPGRRARGRNGRAAAKPDWPAPPLPHPRATGRNDKKTLSLWDARVGTRRYTHHRDRLLFVVDLVQHPIATPNSAVQPGRNRVDCKRSMSSTHGSTTAGRRWRVMVARACVATISSTSSVRLASASVNGRVVVHAVHCADFGPVSGWRAMPAHSWTRPGHGATSPSRP